MCRHTTVNKPIIYLLLITFVAGCTTTKSLYWTDAHSLSNQVNVGDKVRIVRINQTEVAFPVGAVSDEGIGGNGVFVAYSDIQQVQVSTVKPLNDKWVIGIVVILAAAFVISQAECRNDDVVAQYCPN